MGLTLNTEQEDASVNKTEFVDRWKHTLWGIGLEGYEAKAVGADLPKVRGYTVGQMMQRCVQLLGEMYDSAQVRAPLPAPRPPAPQTSNGKPATARVA